MKRIEFYQNRKTFVIISAAIIAIGLICTLIFGVDLDIQFKGGSFLSYNYEESIDLNAVEDVAEDVLKTDVSVTTTTDPTGATIFKISTSSDVTVDENEALDKALAEKFPSNKIVFNETRIVSPSMGASFLFKSLVAIALAAILMVAYIWWRFRKIGGLSAGAFALIALILDVATAFFAFVIFGIPLNDNFVAVILTIFGYSLNDTIVIFDRIRENEKLIGNKFDRPEIVTRSLNQSFGRAINTSICTLVVMIVLTVFALINNIDSLTSFALPMMFGIVSGFYTSTFITGPMWAAWRERSDKKKVEAA